MKFDVGMIVTIVVVLLFYLRLIIGQRGRTNKAREQYSAVSEKANAKKKKNKNSPEPRVRWENVGVRVRSWWLIGVAALLIAFGVVIYVTGFLGPSWSAAWWVPLNVGIIVFAIAVR